MIDTNLSRPAFTLTVGELLDAMKRELTAKTPTSPLPTVQQPQKQTAHSIKEGAAHFGVCSVTFQKWKNTGMVKYVQHGRKVIIDLDGTLELLGKKHKRA